MALRKALKLIRGLRRQIPDVDEDIMAKKTIDELNISGWEIKKKPTTPASRSSHPEGP